ncbi:uncharacterized protein LOC144112489 [Amblyomma americanum]
MKAVCVIVAAISAGCVWAGSPTDQEKVLHTLFANIGPDNLSLADSKFNIREAGAPNNSTLYRFHLKNGKLRNLHTKLMPKFDKEFCRVSVDKRLDTLMVKCDFDLKDMVATYDGFLSYGANVVQNFTVRAAITEHSYNNNPALLCVSTHGEAGCFADKCKLHDYFVFITAFELNTTTTPSFYNFTSNPKFQNFKRNQSLAREVWTDFNVNMYTKIRFIIINALNSTYQMEIPQRILKLGVLDKKKFREPGTKRNARKKFLWSLG